MMTAADILHEAADLVATQGHTKGRYRDERGRFCTLGALDEACCRTLYKYDRSATIRADATLHTEFRATFGDVLSIAVWNDLDETTPDDVIDLFKRAAKRVENGE